MIVVFFKASKKQYSKTLNFSESFHFEKTTGHTTIITHHPAVENQAYRNRNSY